MARVSMLIDGIEEEIQDAMSLVNVVCEVFKEH